VEDPRDIAAIKQALAAVDNMKAWSKVPRHASAGDEAHKVEMAGLACVTTDNTNIAGG
jgi:hypothetical protein